MILPALGNRQIDSIRRGEIIRLLDKVEDQSGACTADAVLQILQRVFNWSLLRNEDFRSPVVRGMKRYDVAENVRDRILTDDEIRKIWTATEGGGCYKSFIRFLLLTSARRTEAAAIAFEEIKDGVWTLPASRSKTGVEIVRPLSKAALAIIAEQPKIGPCIFGIDGRPLTAFGRRKAAFDKKCGFKIGRNTICEDQQELYLLARASITMLPKGAWVTRWPGYSGPTSPRLRTRTANRVREVGCDDRQHR